MAKDYEKALKTINLANQNDSNTHFLRARILVAMENATINPYEYYQKAYERNNNYQQRTSYLISINNYAEKLENKNQYKEAISMLEKTLDSNQNNALNEKSKGYLLLSKLYLSQGDILNAKRNCEYALEENKTISGPYLMFADIFEREGNLEKAIAYCRFASTQAHNNSNPNINIEQKIQELEQKLARSKS